MGYEFENEDWWIAQEAKSDLHLCKQTVTNMRDALNLVCEYVERPPEPNCSCHINPPCGDCVDHSAFREMFEAIDKALNRK